MTVLETAIGRTKEYMLSRAKLDRKAYGQFFTPIETARFMASLIISPPKPIIKLLDPGAGSGILSIAAIEELNNRHLGIEGVELACYETNLDILPLLKSNIELIKQNSAIPVYSKIICENYIASQADDFSNNLLASIAPPKYDIVIANPPYYKLSKDSPEALSMKGICHGAPNIYFLFAAMSLFNLYENGELIYLMPRSWTSGAYFALFRKYLLKNGQLVYAHLFNSRKKAFDNEDVLQEAMILKVRKSSILEPVVRITSSNDSSSFDSITETLAPYDLAVSGLERFVYLPSSKEDVSAIEKVHSFKKTLPEIGFKMKTGLIVDFRNKSLLKGSPGGSNVPLFFPHHLKNGRVVFPIGKPDEYIADELPGIAQANHNYLFLKRFASKEEKRRLQCAVYLASQYPEYTKISTQNKINFIDSIDGLSMADELAYGLYAVFNSSLYDKYYRILNGSTQVNATELNLIPVPDRKWVEEMGRRIIESGDLSTGCCDILLESAL